MFCIALARRNAAFKAGVSGSVRSEVSVFGSESCTWPPTLTLLCEIANVSASSKSTSD
jgi:hypothetical protein